VFRGPDPCRLDRSIIQVAISPGKGFVQTRMLKRRRELLGASVKDDLSSRVQDFYDAFLEKEMIAYRINGNLRLELAKQFLLPIVDSTDTLADIGCGIGIVAEGVATARPHSRVIAVDISQGNINYAKSTINCKNISFFQADITNQIALLSQRAPEGYDVLALIDVIEHVPEGSRKSLFADLAGLAKASTRLALTYPSAEYQRYLISERPEELQIIDNVVEIAVLCQEAQSAGWHLKKYSKVDAWLTNQYEHCVFCRNISVAGVARRQSTLLERILAKVDRQTFRRYRIWRYNSRPFRDHTLNR
jgi:trans-aconitate 2-methyltransferase